MPQVSAVALYASWSQLGAADRAVLEEAAQPLLERVGFALTALSDDLLIVTASAESRHLPVQAPASRLRKGVPAGARAVLDNHPHLWPLGALYAGLLAAKHDCSLVVSSDMPVLNLPLLRYMILLSPDYDVVIPRLAGSLEPLHAIYRQACVSPLELALAGNDPGITRILPGLRVRYVDDTEVDTFDPDHRSFFRIRSPRDWESLEMKPGRVAHRIAGRRKR